jgi:peptidoglycan/LPS O-acetylase OafA/YrhL
MGKLTDLQRLRAVAILMVLFGHTGLALPNPVLHGYTGVSLFFAISGYVVALSIMRRLPEVTPVRDRFDWPFLRDFFTRRVFRIVPVAAVWALISVVVVEGINRLGGTTVWVVPWPREIRWLLSGMYNYSFAAVRMPAVLGHYWSLAVEMHFYILLPFLMMAIRNRRILAGVCAAAALAVTTVLRMVTPDAMIGFLTHTQADALFAGVLICLMAAMGLRPAVRSTEDVALPMWVKNVVFAVLVGALFYLPSVLDYEWAAIYRYPVFTALAAVAVLLAQRNTGWVFGGVPALGRALSYLGDRSYSLYVCHPILWIGVYPYLIQRYGAGLPGWVRSTAPGIWLQFAGMFIVALVVTELSYQLIEVPYIERGKRLIEIMRKRDDQLTSAAGATDMGTLIGEAVQAASPAK